MASSRLQKQFCKLQKEFRAVGELLNSGRLPILLRQINSLQRANSTMYQVGFSRVTIEQAAQAGDTVFSVCNCVTILQRQPTQAFPGTHIAGLL